MFLTEIPRREHHEDNKELRPGPGADGKIRAMERFSVHSGMPDTGVLRRAPGGAGAEAGGRWRAFRGHGTGVERLMATGSALVATLLVWFVMERLQGYEDKALEIRLIGKMGPDIMEKLDGLEYADRKSVV